MELLEDKFRKHIKLCLANDSHSLYVAEDLKNKIIGYVNVHWLPYLFLSGCEGFISELFVLKKSRGKGIGRQLLKFIEEEALTRGCSRLSLLNGRNRESNKRKFYIKNGYMERDLSNFVKKL